jgi:hypothetical protein
MTGVRTAFASLFVLGLTGMGLAVLPSGAGSDTIVAVGGSTPACSSCDARHQRLGQLKTEQFRNNP